MIKSPISPVPRGYFFFVYWAELLTEYCPNVLTEYTYVQNTEIINNGKLDLYETTLSGRPSARKFLK